MIHLQASEPKVNSCFVKVIKAKSVYSSDVATIVRSSTSAGLKKDLGLNPACGTMGHKILTVQQVTPASMSPATRSPSPATEPYPWLPRVQK